MKFPVIIACLLLTACFPRLNVLPSQKVKNPFADNLAGCYTRNSGGAWILLRGDLTARFGDHDGSNESKEKWYIENSTVLFGKRDEVKFWGLDVYLVPGTGYVLSDGVSLFRTASMRACGL